MVLIPIPSFDCVFHGPALLYAHLPPNLALVQDTKRAGKSYGFGFLGSK